MDGKTGDDSGRNQQQDCQNPQKLPCGLTECRTVPALFQCADQMANPHDGMGQGAGPTYDRFQHQSHSHNPE
ncbi:hypothetical protein GCM10009093_25880 [Brevundimonas terrae]|uniref:Uncharacterized protein n=1 Tax=Brevundimonas terrae TaxID=363631 RepID=A0ABN0YK90_9CAUL